MKIGMCFSFTGYLFGKTGNENSSMQDRLTYGRAEDEAAELYASQFQGVPAVAAVLPVTTETISSQLCPKCNGNKRLPNDGISTAIFRTCDICNGAGTLPVVTRIGVVPEISDEEIENKSPEILKRTADAEMWRREELKRRIGK